MKTYDYLAIGAGSGGIASINRAASYGARCAIISGGDLGGTCVNAGCVPKKVMWHAANIAHTLHAYAADYGFDMNGFDMQKRFNFSTLKSNRQAYIQRIRQSYAQSLAKNNVDVIDGFASFMNNNTIEVDGKQFRAKHILIATGSKPRLPAISGADLGIDSDDFFALEQLPKSVVIVGGGYIGVELVGVLNSLGAAVTLVVRQSHLLTSFDSDMTDALSDIMHNNGITIIANASPNKISKNSDKLTISLNNGQTLSSDCLIWATGRLPNIDPLQLQKVGVAVDAKGYILTDEWQNTNVSGIYALGDVAANAPSLTPVAVAAGRQLAERLFNNKPDAKLDDHLIPTVIFSHPPLATIGLSEQEALRQYDTQAIRIYRSTFTPMLSAITQHREPCHVKLICLGEQQKIIGLHGLGLGVDEMLQGFAVAIKMGATKSDFDNTIAIHPTGAEEFVTMR